MSLQEQLNKLKKESIAKRPPETVAVLRAEVEKLVKSGLADKVIKSGEILPEFILPDEKGHIFSSMDLLARGPIAVSFYRGIW